MSLNFIPFCQIQIQILHPSCLLPQFQFTFHLNSEMAHDPGIQVTTNTHLPVTFVHEPWSHKG